MPSYIEVRRETCENAAMAYGNPPTVGVVLHIYYEDVAHDILDRLARMDRPIHRLIVTHSARLGDTIIEKANRLSTDVRYRQFSNRGRDVEPFLSVLSELTGCEYAIKLHTKDWRTPVGNAWYFEMLHNLVGSDIYDTLVGAFENDTGLSVVGPKATWLSALHFSYENQRNIDRLQRLLWDDHTPAGADFGFFAGTMFWFRTLAFRHFSRWTTALPFSDEAGAKDGAPEHAYERVFAYRKERYWPVGVVTLSKDGPVLETHVTPSKTAISKTLRLKHNLPSV